MDEQTLRELELTKTVSGVEYPTNALVLFSADDLRRSLFPFAKVECARFKGTTSEEFIDQKSILSNIATQAEEAYNFAKILIGRRLTLLFIFRFIPVFIVLDYCKGSISFSQTDTISKDTTVVFLQFIDNGKYGILLEII